MQIFKQQVNKRFLYITVPLIFLLITISVFFFLKNQFIPAKVHYHAGFIVFQNNKKLSFSDSKYMFIEPCALSQKSVDSTAVAQIKKAHLHDNVGDLVHIEHVGAKWQDLFININFPIDYSSVVGYINGKKIFNFQTQSIHPYDSLVVLIGKNDSKFLKQAVTKDYMIKMAKKSTTCGD